MKLLCLTLAVWVGTTMVRAEGILALRTSFRHSAIQERQVLPHGSRGWLWRQRSPVLWPMLPAPGVYETVPYSCLVVVPGPHPDDRSIRSPAGPDPRMPTVRPDLQFIPRAGREH